MILIPGYKGGQTLNLFDPVSKQTYQTAKDLDVYADTNLLRPHRLKHQAITNPTISGGSDYAFYHSFVASNGKTYVLGSATISSAVNFVLWSTSTLDASPTWTADYNVATGSPGAFCDEYKDGLYFSAGTNFDKWANLSGTPSRSNIGTLDSVATFIRTHHGLGKIYAVHGTKVASWDNSTFTAAALTVDTGDTIVGLEPFGRFMIVGVRGAGSKRSRFLVWDGVSTTVDDVIDLGDVGLRGFRVVGGVINYITMTVSSYDTDLIRLATVVPGGTPKIIKEQPYDVSTGNGGINLNAFAAFGDIFFYGFNGSDYDIDLGIYAYGSGNSDIKKFWGLWRLVHTGVTSAVSIFSINHTGDNIIIIWATATGGGTYYITTLKANSITMATAAYGVYQSNAFPLNNGKLGRVKRIIILHKPLPASCGFTVKLKHIGHYPIGGSVASEDSFATLNTPQGNSVTSGFSQSTTNAAYTVIEVPDKFKEARFAQLQIEWDEVNSTDAAEIIFPIFVETVDSADKM